MPYDNIVNDVLIQPGTGGQVVLANAAWRSGAAYNGFYLSTAGGAAGHLHPDRPQGDLNNADVGNAEFAFSADGTVLPGAESRRRLSRSPQTPSRRLHAPSRTLPARGTGSPTQRQAGELRLGARRSAQGYSGRRAGLVQQLHRGRPGRPQPRLPRPRRGLRDRRTAAATWKTIGPVLELRLPLLRRLRARRGGCPPTTHPDQHSIAFDGGTSDRQRRRDLQSRPLAPTQSTEDAAGHATDWVNHNAGLRTLQYYSVGAGADPNARRLRWWPAACRTTAARCCGAGANKQMVSPVRRRRRRHHRQPAQRLPDPRRIRLPRRCG